MFSIFFNDLLISKQLPDNHPCLTARRTPVKAPSRRNPRSTALKGGERRVGTVRWKGVRSLAATTDMREVGQSAYCIRARLVVAIPGRPWRPREVVMRWIGSGGGRLGLPGLQAPRLLR